jgi:hypothetical protein
MSRLDTYDRDVCIYKYKQLKASVISIGESEKCMCILKLEPGDASPSKDCPRSCSSRASFVDFDMTIYM